MNWCQEDLGCFGEVKGSRDLKPKVLREAKEASSFFSMSLRDLWERLKSLPFISAGLCFFDRVETGSQGIPLHLLMLH